MSRTEPTPDTSMEDILASIRRIIADEPEPAVPDLNSARNGVHSGRNQQEPAFADDIARALNDPDDDDVLDTSDDDILDLGGTAKAKVAVEVAEVPVASPVVVLAPDGAEADFATADDDIIDDAPIALETPLDPPLPSAPVAAEPEPVVSAVVAQGTATTEAAFDPPLPAAVTGAPVAASTMVPRSLEDMVAEMLRPMLRDWLDANMPRLVAKAIAAGAANPTDDTAATA